MPWVLTRGNDGAEIGYRVAGFISEWWPTSNRNGDRHRLGKAHSWADLYVDPRSGLLRRNKARLARTTERRREADERAKALARRLRELGPWRQLHLLDDGNWWEVELAPAPAGLPALDAIERAGLSPLPRAERYARDGVYAAAKRPLSRREIVALKLRT